MCEPIQTLVLVIGLIVLTQMVAAILLTIRPMDLDLNGASVAGRLAAFFFDSHVAFGPYTGAKSPLKDRVATISRTTIALQRIYACGLLLSVIPQFRSISLPFCG